MMLQNSCNSSRWLHYKCHRDINVIIDTSVFFHARFQICEGGAYVSIEAGLHVCVKVHQPDLLPGGLDSV